MNNERFFEVVPNEFRQNKGAEIQLPTRGSKASAGYDFICPIDVVLEPNKITKIVTDVRAYMGEDEVLLINVRSSMGKYPISIANTQGWIDSDYYGNETTGGNIMVSLINHSDQPIEIKAGERLVQGMFIKYLTARDGNVDTERTGGIGSTGK